MFGSKQCDIVVMIGTKELKNNAFIVRDKEAKVTEVHKDKLIELIKAYVK